MIKPRAAILRPLALLLALLATSACKPNESAPSGPGAPPTTVPRAGYVGSESCAKCHPMEVQKFATSDHHRAMAKPTKAQVMGDFNHVSFTHFGVTSTFDTQGGNYFVTTENAEGKLVRYEVAYVFGFYPLQQYLVLFPGGRLQCLPLAYDTRDKKDGGQRWFHLYGNDPVPPGDPLFWTGPLFNWNHMCASCHSTALEKGYDEKTDSFHTTWANLTLTCESCHGPAKAHLDWIQNKTNDVGHGFAYSLVDREKYWVMNPTTGIAKRMAPPPPAAVVDTCARCHARANLISETAHPSAPLDQARQPVLLDEGLYHATGEIQDEDYEWGSFTQSRMHQAGVTCVNCHDPHSGKTHQRGNMLCAQCHLPSKFDVPSHLHHQVGSPGAQCINCHMPTHVYMGVDTRRDHGFRVPRPDLTARYGKAAAPNTCNTCHTKPTETPQWAAAQILKWNGGKAPRHSFSEALCAANANTADSAQLLAQLARDGTQGAVVRATALHLLLQKEDPATFEKALQAGLDDPEPLIRAVAVSTLNDVPEEMAAALGAPALSDSSKWVRLAAVRALIRCQKQLSPKDQALFEKVLEEARLTLFINADRAEAQVNLGTLDLLQGDFEKAVVRFTKAIDRNPNFVPGWLNLADLQRQQGHEEACQKTLESALAKVYDKAPVHYALGLLFIRKKDLPKAVAHFESAIQLRPEVTQYTLLLALAKDAQGHTQEAIDLLEKAHKQHGDDAQIQAALESLKAKIQK